MIKLVCFVIFVTLQTTSFAQGDKTDSLKNLLSSTSSDTIRVNLLTEIAYAVYSSSPAEVEKYALEMIELSEKLDYPVGLAEGYKIMGISHYVRANYIRAIEAYKSALAIASSNNNSKLMASILANIGLSYAEQGEYIDALDNMLQSMEIAETLNNQGFIVNLINNIAIIYGKQGQYDHSLSYFEKALAYARETNDIQLLARVLNNMAVCFENQGKYQMAIKLYEEAINLKLDDQWGLSATFYNLSKVCLKIKDYKRALSFLEKSYEIKQKVDDRKGVVNCHVTRATILIQDKRFEEAKVNIDSALFLAKQLDTREPMKDVYEAYSTYYEAIENYEQAFLWKNYMHALKDSLFNETKSRQLGELQALYEIHKKEKEIVILEKERTQERFAKNTMIIILGFFIAIVAGAGYFIWFRIKERQQRHLLVLKLHKEALENAAHREDKLEKEIQFKNKELASYTMNFVQKSELMEELKRSVSSIVPEDTVTSKKLASITKLIDSHYQVDREWEDFKLQFENVHANFFKQLKERYPELTNGDLKLCALLKLNMNMKEAARILGISPESVKTARYRLRKKFELNQDDKLIDFILSIEGGEKEMSM